MMILLYGERFLFDTGIPPECLGKRENFTSCRLELRVVDNHLASVSLGIAHSIPTLKTLTAACFNFLSFTTI